MFNKCAYLLSVRQDFGYKGTVFLAFIIIFPIKTFGFLQIHAELFNKSGIFTLKTP